jgi:hypothetical protein
MMQLQVKKMLTNPTIAPSFAKAAENPCPVTRNSVKYTLTGIIKVIGFGSLFTQSYRIKRNQLL